MVVMACCGSLEIYGTKVRHLTVWDVELFVYSD